MKIFRLDDCDELSLWVLVNDESEIQELLKTTGYNYLKLTDKETAETVAEATADNFTEDDNYNLVYISEELTRDDFIKVVEDDFSEESINALVDEGFNREEVAETKADILNTLNADFPIVLMATEIY